MYVSVLLYISIIFVLFFLILSFYEVIIYSIILAIICANCIHNCVHYLCFICVNVVVTSGYITEHYIDQYECTLCV